MSWRYKIGKITSILLIGTGLYQIFYSTVLLIFVYPQLKFGSGQSGTLLYEGLVEKAIVYYLAMAINGFYGLALMFKSEEELTYFQILGGLIIFSLSVFFITKTPVTNDPIFKWLTSLIKR
ncbi:MAG TPA: hypothetical protein VMY36_00270 [Patescibacteria group bacterium]|nr:hypothetical protein [Patescibacteria group bacterium]